MARERTKSQAENNNDNEGMQANDNDTDFDDDFAFDEVAEEALPDATFREVFERSHLEDPDECWETKEPVSFMLAIFCVSGQHIPRAITVRLTDES